MPSIFISYRRGPSAGYAAHSVTEKLKTSIGSASIVLDVDSIPLGTDFREFLDDQVSKCDVFLAIISDEWHEELAQRFDDPTDFVQIEIRAALQRNIPVVPVLVGSAAMPAAKDLPEDLVKLAYRQAAELRIGADYQAQLNRLVRGITQLLATRESTQKVEEGRQRAEAEAARKTESEDLRADLSRMTSTRSATDVSDSAVRPVALSPTRQLSPGQTFRDTLKDGGEGPLMVVIPAGRFLMGSPPHEPEREAYEGPQHEVRIPKPFLMGVYAVTFDDYDRLCEDLRRVRERPSDESWGRGKLPVINVSWGDAQLYCEWLSEQTGRLYRLPSEAEWEYACRAGTTTPFHFGLRISTDQANFDGNNTYSGSDKGEFREKTTPVDSFPPNDFGLHDMHGNVWEWCQDAWHDSYAGAPQDGSAWEGDSVSHVARGGSWFNYPLFCRAAYRSSYLPVDRCNLVGFRVCSPSSS